MFSRVFLRNAKKTHTDQSTQKVFFLCLKNKDSQPFKSSSCEKLFVHCACYRCNLLRWIFFIPFDNWKSLLFVKVCSYFEIILAVILQLSLKQVFWKKSVFYMISTISLQRYHQSFKIKPSYTVLDKLSELVLWLRFYTLYFATVPHFSLSMNFLWKTQNLCKNMFFA